MPASLSSSIRFCNRRRRRGLSSFSPSATSREIPRISESFFGSGTKAGFCLTAPSSCAQTAGVADPSRGTRHEKLIQFSRNAKTMTSLHCRLACSSVAGLSSFAGVSEPATARYLRGSKDVLGAALRNHGVLWLLLLMMVTMIASVKADAYCRGGGGPGNQPLWAWRDIHLRTVPGRMAGWSLSAKMHFEHLVQDLSCFMLSTQEKLRSFHSSLMKPVAQHLESGEKPI